MKKRPARRTGRLNLGSFFIALAFLVAGLGMLAACIGVATGFAHTEIQVRRVAGISEGSFRFVLGGVPVFWRSLDGLARVERDDYEIREESKTGRGPLRTVSRMVFLDAEGQRLMWSERTPVLNEMEALTQFLTSTPATIEADRSSAASEYHFVEPSQNWTLRRFGDALGATFAALLLMLGGLLCTIGGASGLWTWARKLFTRD